MEMNDHLRYSYTPGKTGSAISCLQCIVEGTTYTHTVGKRTISVTLNNWAEQASGSVFVQSGDTTILATAVMHPTPREGGDFFPLTVDYEEKYYATGKILGSRFIKRETRPTEEAILVMRLVDRTIRPRFDLRIRNEVQVVITALSIDDDNDPDILAILGASLALGLSEIPWGGPVAGIRVGRNEGDFILNPSYKERETCDLEVAVSGTKERINMMESSANEISEADFTSAVEFGFKELGSLIEFQREIISKHGRAKTAVKIIEAPKEMLSLLHKEFAKRLEDAVFTRPKNAMREAVALVKKEFFERAKLDLGERFERSAAEYIFDSEISDIVHARILEKGERPDGRKTNELRPLSASVGVIPRLHGSGLFMRGETHALTALTLGTPGDEQIIEGMEVRTKKRFLHHYNFPPYSVGETKPMRGPGRREIGHGALAGKALLPMIPSKDEFPYTIRLVSEILSSNGSTSMASVCGSTLALMDGGVPLKKPVAGAAMGLMLSKKGDFRVLTDLQGYEDHHGDMDFKVAGTRDGITAVQLDVKIDGLTMEMVKQTLEDAHIARMKILDTLEATIAKPRPELSPWAPRIQILKINPEKIGALIGPGGKVINQIIADTGAKIDIEDDGTVYIASTNEESMQKAMSLVKNITREIKAGELLEGRVSRILDFGAMVEIAPRQDGLVHVSELAPWRVDRVSDVVKIGDVIPVKVRNIDDQGRVNLSLKDVPGYYSEADMAKAREQGFDMRGNGGDDHNRRPPRHR